MTNEQREAVAKKALGILNYNDAHPDVGWGMLWSTAMDSAIDYFKEVAGLFDAELVVTESDKEWILDQIEEVRMKGMRR